MIGNASAQGRQRPGARTATLSPLQVRKRGGAQNPAVGAEVATSVCIGASWIVTTLTGPVPVLPSGSATVTFVRWLTGRPGAPGGHRALSADPEGLMSRSTIT